MPNILLLLFVLIYNVAASSNETDKIIIYRKYQYDSNIWFNVNSTTEQIMDFTETDPKLSVFPTRVYVTSNTPINGEHPLFVTATQQKGVSSWELPLVVESSSGRLTFNSMARTLCPHDAGPNITSKNRPTVHISTSNPQNVSVTLQLKRVEDFYVEYDKETTVVATPSEPRYYFFSFDKNPIKRSTNKMGWPLALTFNYTIPKSVILTIESDEDTPCAVVSIQNNSCPVFDNERDMLYQGYHLTMISKGGITLTQSMFPNGFYIVFIVKENDEVCTGVKGTAKQKQDILNLGRLFVVGEQARMKTFRFKIIATISYKEYLVGLLVMLALTALIALFALAVYLPSCAHEEPLVVIEDAGPSTSAGVSSEDGIINGEKTHNGSGDTDSEAESTHSLPQNLTVAGLSKSRPGAQHRRTNRYFWSALTMAVVYALPVIQLLSTYQTMVFSTGDQDLCYYNFLCAHPLGYLSDVNHVISNAGYVILGLVFMMQTKFRQRKAKHDNAGLGIPQHWGIFYSMGVALVMEGVLSACYHLCPNKMNFQFDSSFMYVMAVLCMVKLYQNRHTDVNASAHSTFMLLALIIAIGLLGIKYPSVYFWALFTIAHILTCLILTLKIYYVGRFKFERQSVQRAWTGVRANGRRAFVPHYKTRALLLAIANVANWILAGFGPFQHNHDFGRHLLAVLMGNTVLYTMSYVVMKLVYRERIRPHTWLYFVLAHIAWFTGLALFLHSTSKWSETPAMSRRHNAVCTALDFYDYHDLWHMASAAALFLSFNMLLTIDDGLKNTPRHLIPVF